MSRDSESRRAWIKNAAIIFLVILLLLTFFSNTILNYTLPEVSAQYAQYGTIAASVKVTGTVKANESYIKTMDSVNSYEEMVRKSRLVYNDSVTKLNRAIRMFPTSIAAAMLGIRSRDYLETESYQVTEMFINNREYLLKRLLDE